MFDFVFGDQTFPSNVSSRESMDVVSGLPRKEACGGESGDVVGKPGFASGISGAESMEVVDRLPRKELVEAEIGNVVRKPQNDISIFATPLPEFVLEQRQRKLSRESGGSTRSSEPPQPPTFTIIEEGREWYGYRDEGIRQAAEMFGVTGPWIRPSCGMKDVDGMKGMKGANGEGEVKKEKPFWHGNGRKVRVKEVEQRWMCVGCDEFGIVDELVIVGEGAEEDGEGSEESDGSVDNEDSTQGGGGDGGERKWWSVRWKNVFMMLGCGVLA